VCFARLRFTFFDDVGGGAPGCGVAPGCDVAPVCATAALGTQEPGRELQECQEKPGGA